jgi:hypothetical protein
VKRTPLIFISLIGLLLSSFSFSSANADGLGGYAVVDPSTGIVHGVVVANSSDPFGNGGFMPHEYMGCPAGCILVQQSTADKNGNVAGMHGPNVTYDSSTNEFTVRQNDVQSREVSQQINSVNGVIESVERVTLNSKISERVFRFGIQDVRLTDGQFVLNEVAPTQYTTAEITAKKEIISCVVGQAYGVEDCSEVQNVTGADYQQIVESLAFTERKTVEEVQQEALDKNVEIILDRMQKLIEMLGNWIKKQNS